MPMPPILPLIDWKAVFESGVDFDAWLRAAEHPENRAAMEKALQEMDLEPGVHAWLGALHRVVHVVAIAEDWCGDVVLHTPVLARMAQASPNLQVRFITRAQHTDVFARYLTNGGEAIPKFVFLSDKFVECGNWGPMPEACRKLIARGKAAGQGGLAREKVSLLYKADAERRHTLKELLELVETAAATMP